MQPIQRIDPAEVGVASQSYSEANIVGDLVFLAGQAALDPEGRLVASGDTFAQTRYALQRTKQVLTSIGTDLEHVVSVQVFITPEADFAEFNRAWLEAFGTIRPARTTAVTGLVVEGALVELVVTALRAR